MCWLIWDCAWWPLGQTRRSRMGQRGQWNRSAAGTEASGAGNSGIGWSCRDAANRGRGPGLCIPFCSAHWIQAAPGRGHNLGLGSFLPWRATLGERLRCKLSGTHSASSWAERMPGSHRGVWGRHHSIWIPEGCRRVISPRNLHLVAGTLPKRKASPHHLEMNDSSF